MRIEVAALLIALFLAGLAMPLFAHHSFAAEYDKNRPIKFRGIVTKMEWMNPHIYYYVDVKDASGKVTNYAVEGGTPNSLRRQGWGKDSLKAGDVVTVEGFMAKNGSNHVNGRNVMLPNGKRVFGGSADDGGPGTEYEGNRNRQ
jgi:Family of unknown function (DUF6152)